ncbi:IS3 family transposase [Streptomyces sp. NPDC097981]|uniref:IS3 family transposase n=1 Tax=Streptomyces sp. NPDC097981 TaxID=3155428 RepID=UPI00332866A1
MYGPPSGGNGMTRRCMCRNREANGSLNWCEPRCSGLWAERLGVRVPPVDPRSGHGAARRSADGDLGARIEKIHEESNGPGGVPRIAREPRERHGVVNHKRLAGLMRERGPRREASAAQGPADGRGPSVPPAPDLVGRTFAAPAPDMRRAPGGCI